jgi:hypothetical protein
MYSSEAGLFPQYCLFQLKAFLKFCNQLIYPSPCSIISDIKITAVSYRIMYVYLFVSLSVCPSINPSISIYISLYLWLSSPLLDLGRFFSSLILCTVGRTPWTGDQHVARPLRTHRRTQRQNKRTQTSMNWVGFEPTIQALERAKTRGHSDRQYRTKENKNHVLLHFFKYSLCRKDAISNRSPLNQF